MDAVLGNLCHRSVAVIVILLNVIVVLTHNKAILSASMVCYVYFFDVGCEGSSYGRYVDARYL
jgi:hypothetical protein